MVARGRLAGLKRGMARPTDRAAAESRNRSMIPALDSIPLSRRPSLRTLRRIVPIGAVVFALIFTACNSPFQTSSAHARVRIHNDSEFHMDEVRFSSGTTPVLVGRMEAGARSSYLPVSVAYAVAWVEALIDGTAYATPAASFSSHSPLESGTYTYRVTVDSTRKLLRVEVIHD